jgi:hypothetical protein
MFIHKAKEKGKTYYRARESYRDPETGKPRMRTLAQLGPYPTVAEAFAARLAAYLERRAGRRSGPLTKPDRRAFWTLYKLEQVLKSHDRGYRRSPEMQREERRWSADCSRRQRERGPAPTPEPDRRPGFAFRFLKIEEARKVLGVGLFHTPEEIKAARDQLAMRWHPDRGGDPSIMARINEAYETLTG